MHVSTRAALAAFVCALAFVGALALPAIGHATPNLVAGPITDPATGYTYYLTANTNWYDAEAQAEALGGHLAVDRSPTEDAWLRANIAPLTLPYFDAMVVWIGFTDQGHEGNWTWVTGESTPAWQAAVFNTPFYNAFPWRSSGEPNGGTRENCGYFDLDPRPFGGWVDYPCSGADPLLGLVEIDGPPLPQQPQSITFPPVTGAAVGDSLDLSTVTTPGASGKPVTFSVDASSTPGTCSVSGTVVSYTAVGTCVIDADEAAGPLYTAAPEVQQSIAVAKGTPTIVWSPAALDFGTPLGDAQLDASANTGGTFDYSPASGAVLEPGSQTLSVTFTPSDTTDWNSVSTSTQVEVDMTVPPITGSTSGPLNVGAGGSAALVGGTANGPVTVGSGGSLFVGGGATITGPLNISPGATVVVNGATITGPIKSTKDLYLTLCNATITGPLTVSGSAGTLVVGSTTGCAGNTINGPVDIQNNTGGVSFVGNTVGGSITIKNNSGGFSYSGNTSKGNQKVGNNT